MANVQHNSLTGADLHVAGPVTVDLDTTDQVSDPTSPASGHHALYTKAGGLYVKNSAGTVVGPLVDAAGAGMVNPMTTQDDIIVGGTAGAPARLAKGTDGQVLTVDPVTHHLIWATPTSGFADPTTTKGDLIVHGTSTTRLGVGTDGQVLTADSTQTLGVKWAAGGGGGSHASADWEAAISGYAPVHWWKFSEASGNFADSGSAGTLPATASGTINYHATDPWGGTSAAELTATGPGAATTSGLGSIPTGSSDRTMLILFRANAVPAISTTKAVFFQSSASVDQAFFFQMQTTANTIGDIFDLWSDAISGQGPKTSDTAWHLIACGIDATRQQNLYIDGCLASRYTTNAIATTGGNLKFNPDSADLIFADAAYFTSWLGASKLDRLWDIIRAQLS